MTLKTRLAALLLCALPHLASAQMVYGPATITSGSISSTVRVTPNGQAETSLGAALAAVGGCPLSGCTFSGAVNTNGISDSAGIATTGALTFGGTAGTIGTPQATVINNQISYTYPTTTFIRNRYLFDTVTAAANSSQIDEGFFLGRSYGGAFTLGGEINGIHAFLTDVVGTTFTGPMENFESSNLLNDPHQQSISYLAIGHTSTTGSILGDIDGLVTSLTNDNTTAGAIFQYNGVLCKPMSGAGSQPTHSFCLQNTDVNQSISTLGHLAVGTTAEAGASVMFKVIGKDQVAGTFAMQIQDSTQANLFFVRDTGDGGFKGTLNMGSAANFGAIDFFNGAGGGSITLKALTGSAVNATVSFPSPATGTDTIALIGTGQTFIGTQTFSGTLNASGVLQGGGVAGVTCATGAPTASFSSSNGIVTHC